MTDSRDKAKVYVLPLREENPERKKEWIATFCPECSRQCWMTPTIKADLKICRYCAAELVERNKLVLRTATVARLDTGEITCYRKD